MDIVLKTPDGRFNYRVCGVIIHEGRLLAMKDYASPYYYLPGGRVELHETAEHAVLREIEEELGVTARIARALRIMTMAYLTMRLKEKTEQALQALLNET